MLNAPDRPAQPAPPASAGHAAFALAAFTLGDLLERGLIPPARARLIVGRAAAWVDRSDPRAASLLDALMSRIGQA